MSTLEARMNGKVFALLALGLGCAMVARPALPADTPESIAAQGVPPIPVHGAEDLLPYENIRVALLADWHPRERRLLIRTRFAESPQLHEVAMPIGARAQLTFFR